MAISKDEKEPGRFKVVLTIGGISAVVAGLFVFFYVQNPEQRDTLTFAMGAFATASGVTSAYYVGASLRQTSRSGAKSLAETARSSLLTRTFQYPARWGNYSFVPARKVVKDVLDKYQDDTKRSEKIMEEILTDEALERSVIATMSFLEEMALAVRVGAVDEEILERYFRTIVVATFKPLEGWIENVARVKRGKRLYQELEALYDSWSSK